MLRTSAPRRLACGLAVLAALAVPLQAGAFPWDDQQRQLDSLNTLIGQSNEQLKQYERQIASLRAAIYQLEIQLDRLQDELAQEQARLEELQAQIERLTVQLHDKEVELERHKQQLEQRTRFLYKTGGRITTLSLAFSASSFADLLDRVFYLQDIVQANRRLVRQLRADKAAIEATRAEIGRKHELQARVVAQMRERIAQIEGVKAQREASLAVLRRAESLMRQYIAEKERARSEVRARIEQLKEAWRRAQSSGIFIWPLEGTLTQRFGCSPYWFESYAPQCPYPHRMHTGIDLAAPYGAPIYAADSGLAYTFSAGYGYGNYVIILHARNFSTLYAHLSRFAVGSGVQVGKGQVIGYEGSSGNSTGPHLHFEIQLDEVPVNPLAYLN